MADPIVCGDLMLTDMGLQVFRVSREIFDRLPGMEFERIVNSKGSHKPYWVRYGMISDAMEVCFFCNEPQHAAVDEDATVSKVLQGRLAAGHGAR